jgi:cytochrome P450
MMFLLLVAGHGTTVDLIANAMLTLLEHTDQLRKLLNEPSLIKSAVEELQRFNGPLKTVTEWYARDGLGLSGHATSEGSDFFVGSSSAPSSVEARCQCVAHLQPSTRESCLYVRF